MRGAVKIIEEDTGEILVARNESRACIEVHVKGTDADAYRVVRPARHEARRLAALVLYQAEKLGDIRLVPVAGSGVVGLKKARTGRGLELDLEDRPEGSL